MTSRALPLAIVNSGASSPRAWGVPSPSLRTHETQGFPTMRTAIDQRHAICTHPTTELTLASAVRPWRSLLRGDARQGSNSGHRARSTRGERTAAAGTWRQAESGALDEVGQTAAIARATANRWKGGITIGVLPANAQRKATSE